MDIKLVAVDLDGTLLRDDKTLSPETIRAVGHAADCGIEVALATGRTYREFSHYLKLLPSVRYAVACTGASVVDCRTQEELFLAPLTADELREAWRRLRSFQVLFEVFQDGMIFVDAAKPVEAFMAATRNPGMPGTRVGRENFARWIEEQERPAAKIHMFFLETAERDRAWDAVRDLNAFVCCSDAYDLEIMACGVDKGSGLSHLARYLKLDRGQIMAVGDSGNDLGMLHYAGVRAVMANAAPDLKQMANIVADSNEHDGVAKLLDVLTAGQLEPAETGARTLH